MSPRNWKRSETTEQIELFNWARRWERYEPALGLMYHVPNEGKRQNGAVLKAMGLRPGVPDVVLPYPSIHGHYGLYIEMKKRDRSNGLSADQRQFIRLLHWAGYRAEVAYGADEAIRILEEYLEIDEE